MESQGDLIVDEWRINRFLVIIALLVIAFMFLQCGGHNSGTASPAAPSGQTFTNPIVRSQDTGDPKMWQYNGSYYFTFTPNRPSIEVWRSNTITGIDCGTKSAVWTAPATGPYSQDIWGPRIFFLQGNWYLYVAADDGNNANHRMYVLEGTTSQPDGPYIMKGKIASADDGWAIDGGALQANDGSLYFVWSGTPKGDTVLPQNVYIAPMSDPLTISGPRVMISTPTLPWEQTVAPIEEGFGWLWHNNQFIFYSADAAWSSHYKVGYLVNQSGNLLDPTSWTKAPEPVLQSFVGAEGAIYAPGQPSFVKSADGSEDWVIFHTSDNPVNGYTNRKAHAQQFTWDEQGNPVFGQVIPRGIPIAAPSGEIADTACQEQPLQTDSLRKRISAPRM
jgi:GH43 family beta-xylosidase